MKIVVEPELETLRDALSARTMTSVRPLADQADLGQASSCDLWAAVRDLGIVGRELLKRNGS